MQKQVRLTRDMILNAQDAIKEDVYVPEWGGTVTVKGMSGKERDFFEASLMDAKSKNNSMNLQNMRAKLVSMTVVDEEGKRLFEAADIEALGQKSAAALDRLFTVAQKLSKLTDTDLDELVKN